MTRPDLKPEFHGWQASDPTPQEKSEGWRGRCPKQHIEMFVPHKCRTDLDVNLFLGVYCCGPVPVRAIKEGDLLMKYDAPFVFAEVNADVNTFRRNKDGSTTKVISTEVVGQKISTKSVGSDTREDVTHLYKYAEGKGATSSLNKDESKQTKQKNNQTYSLAVNKCERVLQV